MLIYECIICDKSALCVGEVEDNIRLLNNMYVNSHLCNTCYVFRLAEIICKNNKCWQIIMMQV